MAPSRGPSAGPIDAKKEPCDLRAAANKRIAFSAAARHPGLEWLVP